MEYQKKRGLRVEEVQEARPTCYECLRPAAHCYCGLITPFKAHCNILILQHPHERRKYYSTARLTQRALINSRLMRGLIFDPGSIERALGAQIPYLLFPGADAIDCETIALDSSHTVIVVDGTWSEAGKVVRRNPFLSALPRISFNRPLRSNYRIRKQPRDHYLSTIESVGHLLQLNATANPATNEIPPYDDLFTGFSRMVERQLAFFPRMHRTPMPGS